MYWKQLNSCSLLFKPRDNETLTKHWFRNTSYIPKLAAFADFSKVECSGCFGLVKRWSISLLTVISASSFSFAQWLATWLVSGFDTDSMCSSISLSPLKKRVIWLMHFFHEKRRQFQLPLTLLDISFACTRNSEISSSSDSVLISFWGNCSASSFFTAKTKEESWIFFWKLWNWFTQIGCSKYLQCHSLWHSWPPLLALGDYFVIRFVGL